MIEIGPGGDIDYTRYESPRIKWRKVFRLTFRLCLIALIMGSCVESITWFGEVTAYAPHERYQPNYHRNYQYYDEEQYERPRSSTQYNEYQQPIEEEEENNDEYNESRNPNYMY